MKCDPPNETNRYSRQEHSSGFVPKRAYHLEPRFSHAQEHVVHYGKSNIRFVGPKTWNDISK